MKKALALLALVLTLGSGSVLAADTGGPAADLKDLVGRINQKLRAGSRTEQALAPELKEFDDLLAKYKADKSDEVAQILFMKAMLFTEVLDDAKKGDALLARLKAEFPKSEATQKVLQKEHAKEMQAKLVEGATFPDFAEQDLKGKPLSIANYKGKVVLVDFWATWCGPCVGELPNVLATYKKHHAGGFEIVGISLDKDRERLAQFMTDHGVVWQQYYDGKGWQNKLAANYGIESIPATFLLDGTGKIIGRDLRGEDLEAAVTKALN